MNRIIIDCDIGNYIKGANVDDGLALSLAIASDDISIEAITTVSGNVENYVAASVATNIINKLKLNIPVFCGSDRALKEPKELWRDFLDNNDNIQKLSYLWDDVLFDSINKYNDNAVEKLIEIVNANPHAIDIIAIGPLTNIAKAISLDKNFASNVKSIVLMGGLFNVKDYIKDTNFGLDPEAAFIVLSSDINIVMAPFDTTTTTLFTKDDLVALEKIKTPLAQIIYETTKPWINFSIKTRGIKGCWVHDVLTVAYLIDKSIFKTEKAFVNIELESAFRGRCYRVEKNKCKNAFNLKPQSKKAIDLITYVDNKALIKLLLQSIESYK